MKDYPRLWGRIEWHDAVEQYWKDNPDSHLDSHEIEAHLRNEYEGGLEQELAKTKALLSELRRLVGKYRAALAQEKLAPSQLNFEIGSVREEIANAVIRGLGE